MHGIYFYADSTHVWGCTKILISDVYAKVNYENFAMDDVCMNGIYLQNSSFVFHDLMSNHVERAILKCHCVNKAFK